MANHDALWLLEPSRRAECGRKGIRLGAGHELDDAVRQTSLDLVGSSPHLLHRHPESVLEHDEMVDVIDLQQGARAEPRTTGPGALVIATERLDAARIADRLGELIIAHGAQPTQVRPGDAPQSQAAPGLVLPNGSSPATGE